MELLQLSKLILVIIVFAFSAFMWMNEAFQYIPLQFILLMILFTIIAIEEWNIKHNRTNALTIGTALVGMTIMLIFTL